MTDPESPVRTETFPCTDAADLQVHVAYGEVLVELADIDVVTVAVYRGSTESRGGLGERLGLVRKPDADAISDAVGSVTTHFTRGRLVVHAPRRRLSPVPLRILVRARPGSKIHLTGDTTRFTVTGAAKTLTGQWNSGDLTADSIEGSCKLRAGSGRIKLGASNGSLDLRIGTSDIDVQRVAGRGARLTTGSGIAAFGTVEADLSLTTGAGTISVADAAAGHLNIRTGPGSIRIGVRAHVTARLDLNSRSGTAHSDLPLSDVAPDTSSGRSTPLQISATTSSGDILVTPAA